MTGLRVATYNLYLGADLSLLFGVADLDELAKQVRVVREQLEATRFEERARAVAAMLGRASGPTSSGSRRCPAGR